MNLSESSMPQNYSKGLLQDKTYDLAPDHTGKIGYILFHGAANLLAANKDKSKPVAFVVDRADGKVTGAFVVQYFDNKDKSNPGNWNLVCTFDENDIPADAKKIYLKDTNTHAYFVAVAANRYCIEFKTSVTLVELLTYFMEILYKWLDENAKADEEVVLDQDGVFHARVGVENGEKVFAVEPAGEIKMIIKDDAAIEK
jgi:hypothetical protein